MKYTQTKIARLKTGEPARERGERTCPICRKKMLVSIGQIQRCHKKCRRDFKRGLHAYRLSLKAL